MWGFDMEDLIQVLVLVLIFGVGIIQFLYRTFVKPLVDAEAQKRQAGGGDAESGKSLRDFLAEVRGEQPQQSQPESPEEVVAQRPAAERARERPRRQEPEPAGEELIWEDREERRRPVPPRRPQVGDRRAKPVGSRGVRQPTRRDRVVRRARESVQEVLQEIADDDRYELGEEAVRGHLEEHLARKFSSLLDAAVPGAASRVHPSKGIPQLGGMGLREALLAQVILGSPRAREPRRGPLGWRRPT
jgi:hypothetical protein